MANFKSLTLNSWSEVKPCLAAYFSFICHNDIVLCICSGVSGTFTIPGSNLPVLHSRTRCWPVERKHSMEKKGKIQTKINVNNGGASKLVDAEGLIHGRAYFQNFTVSLSQLFQHMTLITVQCF